MSSPATSTSPSRPPAASVAAGVLGALLCLAVAAIHVIDQGGFPGDKTPRYVGVGYYLLEAVGVLAALALLTGVARVWSWLLALGVAAGPIVGYLLSRGPGLPSYTDDKGNWAEPLGIVSLVVEGVLLLLALAALASARARAASPEPTAPAARPRPAARV